MITDMVILYCTPMTYVLRIELTGSQQTDASVYYKTAYVTSQASVPAPPTPVVSQKKGTLASDICLQSSVKYN